MVILFNLLSFFVFATQVFGHIENPSSNAVTLESYELGVQEYIDGTSHEVSRSFKGWIDATLSYLPAHAQIIEIGSGFGRDARYIESLGFRVERTDAAEAFVSFLQGKGFAARTFNILTDAFDAQYDLLFANAVFLHFTPEELETVFAKVHTALNKDGILAFTVKRGEGQEWSNAKLGRPRYFCYWSENRILPLLERAGFEVIYLGGDEVFLQIIAKLK